MQYRGSSAEPLHLVFKTRAKRFFGASRVLRGESLDRGIVISVGVDDGERSLVERNSTIE